MKSQDRRHKKSGSPGKVNIRLRIKDGLYRRGASEVGTCVLGKELRVQEVIMEGRLYLWVKS